MSRAQACTENQVSVSLTPGPSTAGSQQYTLSFTNVSAGPCRLKGNPDVAHTNTDGSSIMGISSQLDGNLMNLRGGAPVGRDHHSRHAARERIIARR